jgi:GNAT superfamily N-acetyltransferase
MHVDIRPAREDELAAILPMYEWLFEPPGRTPEWWNPDRAREALAEAIVSLGATVLVAEAPSAELVGLCVAFLDIRSVRFGQRAWVEDLAVHPDHRSRGIGGRLLDAACDWARENGATHLELDTGEARADAQRFYERRTPFQKGFSYSWPLL